ncbi:restriction endonuclease subunit S [Ruminococcus flavefaciens]|uniref:restriction endonuclease subunit S n=1 Tax=Ruminococcus flavefaciens TaxID=1265 RepID=UPI0026F1C24C|nr:restriction endonuclease subunit S [Ruminococcus flavefaciens]
MANYRMMPLNDNVEEMFIGPFGSSLKNECFVPYEKAYCMVYEQKHAIQKTMNVETRYVDENKYNELKRFGIHGGDIIVSCRGTIGETFIVPDDAPFGIMHPSIMKIRLKSGVYNKEYFNLLLSTRLKKHEAEANGSGVKMAISATALGKELFPVPTIEEQNKIASNLDKVTHTIDLCNAILEKLDLLVKSRFVEMFGDPQTNELGWNVVNISEVISEKASNGFFAKRDDYCDDGNVSVLGVVNIVNRMYSNLEALPRTNATNKDIEKYEVKYGDMLFCRSSLVAEGIGKASIVPENTPTHILFECHVIRLPLDLTKCVPEFMQVQSTTDYFRNQVIAQSKTATMTTIGQDGILKTNIILPPIEKQKEYYDFIKQTDKSKSAVKQVLEKAETLKKALMQEYFG